MSEINTILDNFIEKEGLSEAYRSRALRYFVPLGERVVSWKGEGLLCVGLNGAQGSGKSTLAGFLKAYLEGLHGWSVAVGSLDDLYMTRDERVDLAGRMHPLLANRGVPGTHDVGLGMAFVEGCERGDWAEAVCPRFDKARDDRAEEWLRLERAPDLILFEGWCMGAVAEPVEALVEPVNALERRDDAEGVWRSFVNDRLGGAYQGFFGLFSHWIFMRPSSFEAVVENRLKQERRLRERGGGGRIMGDEEVRSFVALFERLTRWMWREFPERADVVVELGRGHEIERMVMR